MAEQATRVLRTGGLLFDGRSGCAVVGVQPGGGGKPFTVYGWSEITITEWIYAIRPKFNIYYSKFSIIGDYGTDHPSTFHATSSSYDYTSLHAFWVTRMSDGSIKHYEYNWIGGVNKWTFIVRRFTSGREYSVWVNGVKKYSATVPSDERTVLEWNPETAKYPEFYKRFVLGANIVFSECMACMNDEVRIYNRALSGDEIYEVYSKGTVIKDGLVLCLPFHEGEGTVAHDTSGYGNNGTLYGGVTWVVKKALIRG